MTIIYYVHYQRLPGAFVLLSLKKKRNEKEEEKERKEINQVKESHPGRAGIIFIFP